MHLDDTAQHEVLSKYDEDMKSAEGSHLPKTVSECLKILEHDKENIRVLNRLGHIYMSEEYLQFDKALIRFEELEGLVTT